MSLFGTWFTSPSADTAIQIVPEAVSVATLAMRGQQPVVRSCDVETLPPGAVVASLTAPNIVGRQTVIEALGAALRRLDIKPRRALLVVPDPMARVSLVRFERVPARADDLEQLLRWQLKKSLPFPVEEASLTAVPSSRSGDGREFLVVVAKRATVRQYEDVCEAVGAEVGVVDLATLCLVNVFLAGHQAPAGDWLLVHLQPTYTSMAIMRGPDVIFFRSRAADDEETLADVVHQTAMYYQDRLAGQGFVRVLLGGMERAPGDVDQARRSLDERLGVPVEIIDPTHIAAVADRITVSPDVMAALAPLLGMLLRAHQEAVAV